MVYEVDYHAFKVICQKCGKTGIYDAIKYQDNKNFFFRRMEFGNSGVEYGEPLLDYYLCADCLGVKK